MSRILVIGEAAFTGLAFRALPCKAARQLRLLVVHTEQGRHKDFLGIDCNDLLAI